MKKLLFILGLLLPSLAEAQTSRNPCFTTGQLSTQGIQNCISVGTFSSSGGFGPLPVGGLATAAAPTFIEGLPAGFSFDLGGKLRTSGVFVPSGTQDINLTQILGAAPSLTNPLWVFPATGATFPISAASLPLPALASTAANQTATQAPVAPATATATKSELIGAQATTSAVNPTNGQQSALSSDTNNNLLVSEGGAPNMAHAQVVVNTGNVSVASARALRRSITVTNITGTSAIYCGNTSVNTTTGMYLGATTGSSITLNTTAAVFCNVASIAQTVSVMETY